jgi:hypothetical protein
MPLRPSNPPSIKFEQLLPGDILLSCGNDILDEAIMAIDQGDYSHATEFLGFDESKKAYMVVEATTIGIDLNPTSIDTDAQTLIDAYRFVSDDGCRFGDNGWPSDPVTDAAKSYVGGNYAYDKLLMVGVVIAATELTTDEAIRTLIRLGGAVLVGKVVSWLNRNSDKTPMTCVEVITAAHWDAKSDPPAKYSLKIDVPSTRTSIQHDKPDPTTGVGDVSDLQHQYASIRKTILNAFETSEISVGGKLDYGAARIPAGSELLPCGAVSLRDIQTSTNLEFLGCIQDKR